MALRHWRTRCPPIDKTLFCVSTDRGQCVFIAARFAIGRGALRNDGAYGTAGCSGPTPTAPLRSRLDGAPVGGHFCALSVVAHARRPRRGRAGAAACASSFNPR